MFKQLCHILFLLSVAAAFAADQCNQFEIILYERIWQVTSFYVQDDIAVNPNKDFEVLKPEGIACRQGIFYAGGDRGPYSTNSRLAVYTYAGNLLTYSNYIQMPNTSPDWWGPDGLAFNTYSDANCLGAGLGDLVSIERDTPPQAGVIDLITGAVVGKRSVPPSDDITMIASTPQFALIADAAERSTVTLYDGQLASVAATFSVTAGARGIASLSSGFAHWFTGEPTQADAFLVTVTAGGENSLAVVDGSGQPLGPPQPLPVLPKARIPFGGGVYMIEPAFGQIEAVAVDEQSQTIFIADFGNAMVHILMPVRLAADLNAGGQVDLADLLILAANWLSSGCLHPAWCLGADIQHDQSVNILDWCVMAEQYGKTY